VRKSGNFPPAGEEIEIFDDKGEKYTTKMHSSVSRIDGLTKWHRNQSTKPGDTIVIRVKYEIFKEKG